MNLLEFRKGWESREEVVLEMPVVIDGFQKLFVVLFERKRYSLLRYFRIGDRWDVSVDIDRHDNLMGIMEHIRGDKDVLDMVNSLHQ